MKNEKVIKIGIVGLGRGYRLVKDSLRGGLTKIKVTAICDKNAEKLEFTKKELAEEFSVNEVQCFGDFEEFLKADTDAVVIATDAVFHVPFVIKALDAGKHVLSEIPAVNSLEEARMLKKAVYAHPELKYMCGENECFLGNIQAWKKMYEEGQFGDIVYAEGEYLHNTDYRNFKPEDFPKDHWRSYNPAIKYLTHDLGPLLYIMNDKCVSVTCMVPDTLYNPYIDKVSQNAVALFKTAKGAVIRIFICFGAFTGYTHNYNLYGTRGSIEVDKTVPRKEAHCFAYLSSIPRALEQKKIDIPITAASFGDPSGTHVGADRKMMRAFVDCIINDTKPPIDVDLAIRMALPGIYAHESYLNGSSAVDIPDVDDFEI
jgi:predicted dehydrogenase